MDTHTGWEEHNRASEGDDGDVETERKDVERWDARGEADKQRKGTQRKERETDTESKGDINKWGGEAHIQNTWGACTHTNMKGKTHAEVSQRCMETDRRQRCRWGKRPTDETPSSQCLTHSKNV